MEDRALLTRQYIFTWCPMPAKEGEASEWEHIGKMGLTEYKSGGERESKLQD